MMLSFTELNENNILRLAARCGDEAEYAKDILNSFLEFVAEGAEIGVDFAEGCLLLRIFDNGKYSFVFPIELFSDGRTDRAVDLIVKYARRELIPVFLTDTPREALDFLTSDFLHIDARAYDEDEDSFVVGINSECDMLDAVPFISGEGLSLSEILDTDAKEYARLSRDSDVNRYWGYDANVDLGNVPDLYFVELARSEFYRGVALSLAIREGEAAFGKFLGEAVLFDFDYRGSAQAALRLLPEATGRGIGKRTLGVLVRLARNIGLKRLTAEILEENTPSLRMTEHFMTKTATDNGKVYFELLL